MRVVKWLFAIVLLLGGVFFIGGMLLPREIVVERSAQIDAPADKIFPHVNNPQATQAWSPWLSLDPDVQVSFGDVKEGVGATMEWVSDVAQVGAGKMEVVESMENAYVVSALDFGDMGLAEARYDLAEQDGKTVVTWGLKADMGSGPIGRWMGLMMDSWVGADYERGLENLKGLIEG